MPRIAVVGAGSWSTKMHMPAARRLQKSGLAEYAAVCDIDAEKAAVWAAELGAVPYADLDTMLRKIQPDGLALIVSCDASPSLILKAAERGLPFLTEKPPATDSQTHRRLLQAVGDLPHMVAYNRRHSPYAAIAKEWMADESVQTVTALFSRYRRLAEDFTTTAVHPIDTTLFLADGNITTARIEIVRTSSVRNFFINGITDAGTHVSITVTPDTSTREEHYIVRGLNRSVRIAFPHPGMIDFPGYIELYEDREVIAHQTCSDLGIHPDDAPALAGIVNEHERFAGILTGTAQPISTLSTALPTQLLREQLMRETEDRLSFDWSATAQS